MKIKQRDARLKRCQKTHRSLKYRRRLAKARGLFMDCDDSEGFEDAGDQTSPQPAAEASRHRRSRQSPTETELVECMRSLNSHSVKRV